MSDAGRRGLRRRAGLWVVAGLALVVVSAATMFPAQAQGPTFFGYSFEASADGVTQSGGDPGSQGYPQVESRTAHTFAMLETNENGRALASSQYPGAFIAGAPQLIGVFSTDIPEAITGAQYPVQAQAASGANRTDSSQGMEARVEGPVSEATAFSPAFDDSDFFTYGEIRTVSRAERQGGIGIATATSTISDISFAGGQIKIDSVVTVAEVRTDGVTAELSGSTTVSGATIGGQPVTIDEDGVTAGDSNNPNPADVVAQAIIENVLTNFEDGAKIELFTSKPSTRDEGNIAEYRSGSLVILMRAGDPGGAGGGLGVIALGGASAYVQAFPGTGPPQITVPPPTAPPATAAAPASPPPPAPTTQRTPTTAAPTPTTAAPTTTIGEVAAPTPPAVLPTAPIVNRFDGVPFALPFFILLGSIAAGRGLVLFHRSLGGASSAACIIDEGTTP